MVQGGNVMYQVDIYNDEESITINTTGTSDVKVTAGQIKREINKTASFDFTILPNNPGYYSVHGVTTRIKVTRVDRNKIEFVGRVLQPNRGMDTSGLFASSYTCADALDYLHDVSPDYQTVSGTGKQIINKLLDIFNTAPGLENYKHIQLGDVGGKATYTLEVGPEKDIYDTIHDFVVTTMGYEMQLRVISDTEMYLDVQAVLGQTCMTRIELARNMQSISVNEDPTSVITRAIPLGAVKQDAATSGTTADAVQKRVCLADIGKSMSVNFQDLIDLYGVQEGPVIFDDVTDASQLEGRLQSWVKTQRVQRKFSVTALDLSKIGLEADDFDVYNYYPVENSVMGVDEPLRVTAMTLDIVNIASESLTIGDKYKNATDYALESLKQVQSSESLVERIKTLAVTTGETSKNIATVRETVNTLQKNIEDANLSGIAASLDLLKEQLNGIDENIANVNTTINTLQEGYLKQEKRLDDLEVAIGGGTSK
jgi:hypothetical protein